MVVCKCRKATKLYCFVHKVPICGECICFPEHQTCVSVYGNNGNFILQTRTTTYRRSQSHPSSDELSLSLHPGQLAFPIAKHTVRDPIEATRSIPARVPDQLQSIRVPEDSSRLVRVQLASRSCPARGYSLVVRSTTSKVKGNSKPKNL
ncbi:hypothetical protein F2Q69_00052881 [Brassica cretica]|uniref:ZFPL1-like B-box zinc-binding domain-containing protein n=1 Tax=Brassica cretica TaxID=69181 RepID=A0A8S9N8F4_BRACR|nr:hypothetical protein F2Q69_00052881 [Brassica cretica]